ncbi:MAG: class I SAM-dependent RNA methyltransferase, partial [Candidatus Cloacimonetes bacterium]|nr:class I SAM-dependent RNA methyltransferase [Candidatus Cloacimonadota bacterium]
QQHGKFFAQVAGSMEDLGALELKEFGAKEITPVYRGVHFKTDISHIYRINFQSKFISRILAPLITFDCHSTKYLYSTASNIEWDKLLNNNKTFAIYSNVSNSKITHSRYATLVLKDAIADYFTKKYNARPDINTDSPDVVFNLFIHKNRATISLDTSGDPLHKRGYRQSKGSAPLQETLAAAIVKLSGWNGKIPLYDPMCGSGTLLCEALMNYCRIPSGFKRKRFGFENLPEFDESEWKKIKENSTKHIRELPKKFIFGSDMSYFAIEDSKLNFIMLPSAENIDLKQTDFMSLPEIHDATIICNPPYGIRLGTKESTTELYKNLGDFLKQKCKGCTAYIYVGDKELIPAIGLKPSFKRPLKNGNLDGRLLKIEIY